LSGSKLNVVTIPLKESDLSLVEEKSELELILLCTPIRFEVVHVINSDSKVAMECTGSVDPLKAKNKRLANTTHSTPKSKMLLFTGNYEVSLNKVTSY
jgi:hypothetical protein